MVASSVARFWSSSNHQYDGRHDQETFLGWPYQYHGQARSCGEASVGAFYRRQPGGIALLVLAAVSTLPFWMFVLRFVHFIISTLPNTISIQILLVIKPPKTFVAHNRLNLAKMPEIPQLWFVGLWQFDVFLAMNICIGMSLNSISYYSGNPFTWML